jgi:hypothetical protein
VGTYEDLILETVEAVMPPGEPMSVVDLARLVAPHLYAFSKDERYPTVDALALSLALRSSPHFIEVAPGVWVRRSDGPEAGVPSRPRRSPFAGSAAAEAPLPERRVGLDVTGAAGGRATVETAVP